VCERDLGPGGFVGRPRGEWTARPRRSSRWLSHREQRNNQGAQTDMITTCGRDQEIVAAAGVKSTWTARSDPGISRSSGQYRQRASCRGPSSSYLMVLIFRGGGRLRIRSSPHSRVLVVSQNIRTIVRRIWRSRAQGFSRPSNSCCSRDDVSLESATTRRVPGRPGQREQREGHHRPSHDAALINA